MYIFVTVLTRMNSLTNAYSSVIIASAEHRATTIFATSNILLRTVYSFCVICFTSAYTSQIIAYPMARAILWTEFPAAIYSTPCRSVNILTYTCLTSYHK